MVIIEMNPHVSRSSALASKATGFPIAKIAAKLAVGYRLDELKNEITKVTPASFEPTIDYIVTKLPRFAFEKFQGAEAVLTTSMQSVGEVMAIGRSFKESLQKALRSLETGLTGLDELEIAGARRADGSVDQERVRHALSQRAPDNVLRIAEAFRLGLSVDAIHQACRVDRWFLRQIADLVAMEEDVRRHGLPGDRDAFAGLKRAGFSDMRLAKLAGLSLAEVRLHREQRAIHPVFKRVDSCAAEFRSVAPYLYSTYEYELDDGANCEADPSERDKILILGGGPNRIGQGIDVLHISVSNFWPREEPRTFCAVPVCRSPPWQSARRVPPTLWIWLIGRNPAFDRHFPWSRRTRRRPLAADARAATACSLLHAATNARAMVDAIERQQTWEPSVRSLQSYARSNSRLKLFIRQPLTKSGDESKGIVQGVSDRR